MFLQPRVRNQIALCLAALVFVLVAIGIYVGARRSLSASALVNHSHEVISHVDAVQASVLDAESAERGYLLTGNTAYLAHYRLNLGRLPVQLQQLRALVLDDRAQVGDVDRLQELVQQRVAQVEQVLDLYEAHGLDPARSSMAVAGFGVTSAINEQARSLVDREKRRLAARSGSSDQSADHLLLLTLTGIPLGLLLVGFVYLLLLRELQRRSEAERNAAQANAELATSLAQLERSSEDRSRLASYTGLLQSCASAEEALELTGRVLSGLLPELGGSVYLLRPSHDRAEALSHWGAIEGVQSTVQLAPEQCWALRRGTAHLAYDLQHDAVCPHVRLAPGAETHAATACIPMIAQGVQLGFLFIAGPAPEKGGAPPRCEIAVAAAEQLSLALSNLRLRETLRHQSIRDPLTGLYNRRYLEESLGRELARCGRRQLPLSVLMLDVDHFKQFNDSQGHAGGDLLLAAIGHLLQEGLRGEDIACRYGGEEFTLILPETGGEEAHNRAAELLQAIAALAVDNGARELPRVTASIGIASFPGDGRSGIELIRKADAALYRAKRNGRNRVELHRSATV